MGCLVNVGSGCGHVGVLSLAPLGFVFLEVIVVWLSGELNCLPGQQGDNNTHLNGISALMEDSSFWPLYLAEKHSVPCVSVSPVFSF